METVILANGKFPEHPLPLSYLKSAERIVCCDGAVESLVRFRLEPFAIIGDCDSLGPEIIEKYGDRIFVEEEQETNDLTKSVKWCVHEGYTDLVIIGATGKREDHTLGNISLLAEYSVIAGVKMITDTGIFLPFQKSARIKSLPGQQISIFSINPETEISSVGLMYPLKRRKLRNWWEATLNEALGESFSLEFAGGPLIIYLAFM